MSIINNKIVAENFWQKLKKQKRCGQAGRPIIVLAPMADVTDYAFRQMFLKYGRPDVFWTEFVSSDGLCLAPREVVRGGVIKGRAKNSPVKKSEMSGFEKLMADLKFNKKERPIVAQLFSANPDLMKKATEMVAGLGFSGIDINMGCPDRGIEKQEAGSAMIKNPPLARKIIQATREGILNAVKSGALKNPIPISVKTRVGYYKDELETWLPELLAEKPAVITLHARTRKEMSKVPAQWERVRRAVKIRDEAQTDLPDEEKTLIFGNGDVSDLKDAYQKAKETGCDGIMIGRGIFGNPWVFTEYGRAPKYKKSEKAGIKQTLKALIEHTKLFEKHVSHKNFAVMKKHFKAYAEGFLGAKELRVKLMECETYRQVKGVVKTFIKNFDKSH